LIERGNPREALEFDQLRGATHGVAATSFSLNCVIKTMNTFDHFGFGTTIRDYRQACCV